MLEPDSNYRAFRRSAQYRTVVRSKAFEKRSTRGKQLTVRPYRSENHLPNQQRRRRRRTSSMPYVMSDRDLRRPTFTCNIEKKPIVLFMSLKYTLQLLKLLCILCSVFIMYIATTQCLDCSGHESGKKCIYDSDTHVT